VLQEQVLQEQEQVLQEQEQVAVGTFPMLVVMFLLFLGESSLIVPLIVPLVVPLVETLWSIRDRVDLLLVPVVVPRYPQGHWLVHPVVPLDFA
jgi:uncharacterized membrane protein